MATLSKDLLIACHQSARQAVSAMELPFGQFIWRGLGGMWKGNEAGSSIDFRDHHVYSPGDDPRHINWQIYGRTGDYVMKVYEQEIRPQVDIVFDGSASMAIDKEKERRSIELLYFCLENAWKAGASVRLRILRSAKLEEVDLKSLSTHQWSFNWFRENESKIEVKAITWNKSGFRVLVSDLLYQMQGTGHLGRLPVFSSNSLGLVLVPFSVDEVFPKWTGNIEFENCETGVLKKQRIQKQTIEGYKQRYYKHFGLWREACSKRNIRMARVSAKGTLQSALRDEALTEGCLDLAL
ncbi:MAG: DUF58 domain-containing protein [Verrucomicrobiota bacterium]